MPTTPRGTDWREWADAFALAIGWGAGEVKKRADTADCLDKHRAAGDIR